MRKPIDMQMSFGEIPIDKIKFDLKSRDEIPKVLIGFKTFTVTWKSGERYFRR